LIKIKMIWQRNFFVKWFLSIVYYYFKYLFQHCFIISFM
jgi:hypothetical protein